MVETDRAGLDDAVGRSHRNLDQGLMDVQYSIFHPSEQGTRPQTGSSDPHWSNQSHTLEKKMIPIKTVMGSCNVSL